MKGGKFLKLSAGTVAIAALPSQTRAQAGVRNSHRYQKNACW